jgi:hypothetical protein
LEFVLKTFKPTGDLKISLFQAYPPVPGIETSYILEPELTERALRRN